MTFPPFPPFPAYGAVYGGGGGGGGRGRGEPRHDSRDSVFGMTDYRDVVLFKRQGSLKCMSM